MKKTATAPDALSKRNLWAYPLGGIGRDIAGTLWSAYLLTYVLYTKTLTDEQFAAVSMIIVVARIFDAFNDPIMGNILEITRTKWGKFKPWITIGMVLSCIVFYFSFSNSLQGWDYVISFGVLYFCYSIAFTMNDIAYWGMVPSLASQKQDRDMLTSRAVLFAGIGGGIATIIVPTLTVGDLTLGGSAVTAYSQLCVIFCIVFIAMQSITLFGVKEKPLPPKGEGQINKVGLKTIFQTLKNNDQLLWCMVVLLCQQVGNGLITGGLASNYIYFEFGYNGILSTLFAALGAVAAGVMMVFFSPISRRFSRDKMMKMAVVSAVGGYLFILAVGLLLPTSAGMVKFALMMVGNLFGFAGMNIIYLITMINIANTVEYNEWKTGDRAEGIIFSVRPLITKFGMAITQFLVMVVFIVTGVRGTTNQISEIENAAVKDAVVAANKTDMITSALAGVPQGQKTALLFAMTLLPTLLAILSYWFYHKKFTINEDRYDQIQAELLERRAKVAQQAETE